MAHTVETLLTTPTAEVRDLLNRAERQLPVLDSSNLVEYLRSLDRVEYLMESLTSDSVDLRPEMTRWLDLADAPRARATQLVKIARPLGGFAALRADNPPAVGSWWRLDELVAADRKRNWTRWLVTALVVAAVLAVAAFVYQQWLAPSPEVVLAVSAVNDVEQLSFEQKWDEASALAEDALQKVPDNPDLLVWAGVLAERRGDTAEAAGYLARAQQVLADPLRYELALSMRRLQASDVDGAEAAAQAALAINPNEPQAVFLLANVAELRNQPQEALDLYQKTADLAEDTNPQLTVVAKMRFGMLLQQMNYSFGTTPPSSNASGHSRDYACSIMRRSWFAHGWQRAGLALALYTLLALALTWPLVAHFATHVPGDGIDDPSLAWNLWWVKLRLVEQLNPDLFHSGWMFHPLDINLAFYTLTPLNGLLSIPLQLVLGLTVANNLLLLSSFVLGGFGTYLVVRQLLHLWQWRNGAGVAAAVLAGGIYAFASAKFFYAALGQFNIASSQWIPFCVLYLVRMVSAPAMRGKLRAGAMAGLFLVFQAWAELTYASFLLLFIGLLFAWSLLSGKGWRGRLLDAAPFVLVAAIFVVGLLPFLAAMAPDLAAEGDFFGRGGGFADVFSADLQGYLVPTRLHPLIGEWVAGLAFPNDKGQQIYTGYSVVMLAIAGSWGLWRGQDGNRASTRRWLLFWGVAAVTFFLLTLGPQVRWAGRPLPLPGPFALVSQLPFFSGNRYPSRYSVMLLLALAVLSGAGVYWLLTRRWATIHRGWAIAGFATAAGLILFEHLSVPLPLSDQRIPPIYSRSAAEASATPAARRPPAVGRPPPAPRAWARFWNCRPAGATAHAYWGNQTC